MLPSIDLGYLDFTKPSVTFGVILINIEVGKYYRLWRNQESYDIIKVISCTYYSAIGKNVYQFKMGEDDKTIYPFFEASDVHGRIENIKASDTPLWKILYEKF